MAYSGSSSAESGLHQLLRLAVRIFLIITGLILVSFTLSVFIPILIFSLGDSFLWHFFDMQLFMPPFHEIELEIFGSIAESSYYRICMGFIIGLPLAMIFYTGIRFISGHAYSRTVGTAALHIWMVSLFVLAFLAIRESGHISHHKPQFQNQQSQIHMLQKGVEIARKAFIPVWFL